MVGFIEDFNGSPSLAAIISDLEDPAAVDGVEGVLMRI
jgi:hypothetical protein